MNLKETKLVMTQQEPSIVYWLGDNLYLNITNRCSNNCYFCFRNYKDGINSFNLRLSEEPSTLKIVAEIEKVVNKRQWKEIVFCGFGEPFERLDTVLEVTRWLKKRYAAIVRVDTNGQALLINQGREVINELKEAGGDRLSVSLNAHNKQTYDQVCKPKFENAYTEVLNFIKNAREELGTEITAVTIHEADLAKIQQIAESLGVKFRKREYIPCFW
jgi:TatD family-associated radical SAM protein